MIPKIIWQTYKTPKPPAIAVNYIKSWLEKNPEFAWYYFDDAKCDRFIKDHFSDEFYKMYTSLPIGVMKSDIWRIAVVYIYGGIYADLDTECIVTADQWLDQNYNLIVGVETSWGTLGNFVFAAAPRHPALLAALNRAVYIYNSQYFLKGSTPVQNFGADAFSTGILNYIGVFIDHDLRPSIDHELYLSNSVAKKEKIKILDYNDQIFSSNVYPKTTVRHYTASDDWIGKGHDSWRIQEKEFIGI